MKQIYKLTKFAKFAKVTKHTKFAKLTEFTTHFIGGFLYQQNFERLDSSRALGKKDRHVYWVTLVAVVFVYSYCTFDFTTVTEIYLILTLHRNFPTLHPER